MKIRVEKDYVDKDTRKKITSGSELEVTYERGSELVNKGFASEIAETHRRGSRWGQQDTEESEQ